MSNDKSNNRKEFQNGLIAAHVVVVESEATKAEVLSDLIESEEDPTEQAKAFANAIRKQKKDKDGEHEAA